MIFPSRVVAKKGEEDDETEETTGRTITESGNVLLRPSYLRGGRGDVGVGNPPYDILCRSAATK